MDKLPVYCGGDTPRLINNRRLSQLTKSGPLPISLMRMSSPGVETKGWRGGRVRTSEPQPKPRPSRWRGGGVTNAEPPPHLGICVSEPHGEPSQGRRRQ